MTLVQNLQKWKEAVESYNSGDFETSLSRFREMNDSTAKILFNIGRTYISLCDLQAALLSFEDVIKKDAHMAVGHFMLGVVNLMCTSYADALVNFNETLRKLRDGKFIDYRQLGLRYKLYKCEVLLNRAVCLSSLGYEDSAVEDLLLALQCKVEPRHNIIDISLTNLKNGQAIEFIVMDAIFQPPKSKTANLERRDYLGKSQVVVDMDNYEKMESPLALRGRVTPKGSPTFPTNVTVIGELYRVLYDFIAQNEHEVSVKAGEIIRIVETADDGWFTMITNDSRKRGLVPGSYVERHDSGTEDVTSREALLKDLRKKEARLSLRRVQPPIKSDQKTHSPDLKSGTPNKNQNNEHVYVNGFAVSAPKERPKSLDPGKVGRPSKSSPKAEPKLHAGPPKFRRKNSLENLLSSNRNSKESPVLGKRISEVKKNVEVDKTDDDDNEYEEVPDISEVTPYAVAAVRDVVGDSRRLTVYSDRKAPRRPAPPPKVVTTMKPPPLPRAQHKNTTERRRAKSAPPDPPQRPVKIPRLPQNSPTVPRSPRYHRKENLPKEEKEVSLNLTITTQVRIKQSTTAEDIKNSAKDAVQRLVASNLWCEKAGKQIRLDDLKTSSILELVKDGTLSISCNP